MHDFTAFSVEPIEPGYADKRTTVDKRTFLCPSRGENVSLLYCTGISSCSGLYVSIFLFVSYNKAARFRFGKSEKIEIPLA